MLLLAASVATGAAAIRSALSVHCATLHNSHLDEANRIKDEYGTGHSTEVRAHLSLSPQRRGHNALNEQCTLCLI